MRIDFNAAGRRPDADRCAPCSSLARRRANGEYFAGKTLRVIVGLEAGGTADVFIRGFSAQLRKHIPGSPTVVVQNMTGAGGSVASNYTYERATPDGLTIVFNTFHPLAQALGDPTMRARYDQFEYVGAIGDIRVNYMRADVVPGGAKKPADIMKAETVMVGALSNSDFSGTLGQLSLKVLGVKYKPVVGYRGGSDIFLAMQRGEVHFHNTSIGTFRTRSAAFIKSGEGLGISYLVPVDASGNYQRSKLVTEMPAYPDLYKEIHGKLPAGKDWDAFNWLTNQVGELAFIALAPPKTPPAALDALRIGFERATNDPDFIKETVKRNGIPVQLCRACRAGSPSSATLPPYRRRWWTRCAPRSAGQTSSQEDKKNENCNVRRRSSRSLRWPPPRRRARSTIRAPSASLRSKPTPRSRASRATRRATRRRSPRPAARCRQVRRRWRSAGPASPISSCPTKARSCCSTPISIAAACSRRSASRQPTSSAQT